MISTNSRDNHFFIHIFVIGLLLSAGSVRAQQTDFDRLVERFELGRVFNADFSHDYFDTYTGDTVSQEGQLWIAKNRYKIRTANQVVVVDGETSRVYDSGRNRVIISQYDPAEDDFAPSRFLNGVDSTYSADVSERGNGNTRILLTSKDPFSLYQEVEIILNPNIIPVQMDARDAADNIISTQFSAGRFIPLEKEMFNLSYPANAEIVDMRNR